MHPMLKPIVVEFKEEVINRKGFFGIYNDFSKQYFSKIEDVIDMSVRLAYRDIQRVLAGIADYQKEKFDMLNYLKAELDNYFKASPKTQAKFDEWHEKVCTDMKGYLTAYKPANRKGFTYGCAQKILNMSFKYLYCFDYFEMMSKNINRPYFKVCHMTFDKKILKWTGYNKGVTSIDDYRKYMELQVKAQTKPLPAPWNSCSPLCPLEKEFILWEILSI